MAGGAAAARELDDRASRRRVTGQRPLDRKEFEGLIGKAAEEKGPAARRQRVDSLADAYLLNSDDGSAGYSALRAVAAREPDLVRDVIKTAEARADETCRRRAREQEKRQQDEEAGA